MNYKKLKQDIKIEIFRIVSKKEVIPFTDLMKKSSFVKKHGVAVRNAIVEMSLMSNKGPLEMGYIDFEDGTTIPALRVRSKTWE